MVQAIAQMALQEPYVGNKVPASYLMLGEMIQWKRKRGVSLLNWSELQLLAEEAGVLAGADPSESERCIHRATTYLNQIGNAFRFEIKELSKMLIINPDWLSNVRFPEIALLHTVANHIFLVLIFSS